MRRSERLKDIKPIDYWRYNNTGEKDSDDDNQDNLDECGLNDSIENTANLEDKHDNLEEADFNNSIEDISNLLNDFCLDEQSKMDTLIIDEATLYDDIKDFLDEHNEITCVGEIDEAIKRIEELRSAYRRKHKEIQLQLKEEYDNNFGKRLEGMLTTLKSFINHVKLKKKHIQDGVHMKNEQIKRSNQKKCLFLASEVDRKMKDLETIFEVISFAENSDNEVKSKNNDIALHNKEMEIISKMLQELMTNSYQNDVDLDDIENLNVRYGKVTKIKDSYIKLIKEEVIQREIDKKAIFNASTLNIKLAKFKGYNSSTDYYTFKSDFEKLYLKTTPRSMLHDLLKNNFLEDQALLLVKNVDDIDDIWDRLKIAYGDHNMMLSKKLAEVNKLEGITKTRDPDKIIDNCSKIIVVMKDLMKLAKQHTLENKLFHSDTLDKILKLLGESRLTRWLSITCDIKDLEGEAKWEHLISFISKDIKIQQQKQLLQVSQVSSNADNKRPNQRRDGVHHSMRERADEKDETPEDWRNSNASSICSICGEKDHKQTTGPYGRKLVQYFSCKKFVEMSPAERFIELRRKGLCIQCLYPGAQQDDYKHKNGRCQRDYACKHSLHERYPRKKHVLVCEEHKTSSENLELLKLYKSKCIFKYNSNEVATFSKDIRIHHVEASKVQVYSSTSDSTAAKENGIYMFQTIKIEGKNFTIFFDTGCGDFVSRFDAITKLQRSAMKEFDGNITLNGVGGVSTESHHGVYSINIPLLNGGNASMIGPCLERITTDFPMYPLRGEVEESIINSYTKAGGNIKDLPTVAEFAGGKIDLMVGIKYYRYFPEKVFSMPSGLTIFRSCFKSADGSNGVIGGPHEVLQR